MRSVIDILDFSVEELDELMDLAEDMIENPAKYSEVCRGKKLATLFFEPSTRTRMSFEAAMYELGGNVITMEDAGNSSAAKGESVADTAKTVSCYVDLIAMRHPKEGAALVAAESASIPVINAGDGGHCHPTQTLADLLTIRREKGSFDNLTVGLCGDLLYGRTVHSLIHALSRYNNVKFVAISPAELKLPIYMKSGIDLVETTSLEDALPDLDILYMTRIQRERFDDMKTYERLKDSYSLTVEKMKNAKKTCSVLHPLPRVNEISVKVDDDPRACYFKQTLNGKYMRMALIYTLLEEAKRSRVKPERVGIVNGQQCRNPRCICSVEQELDARFRVTLDGIARCVFCETEMKIPTTHVQ